MNVTRPQLRAYLGILSTTLWNFGAEFPMPTLDPTPTGDQQFAIEAVLPGASIARPALIRLAEIWAPVARDQFRRVEYAYDFIEHPLNRRRSFHGHDPEFFAQEFGVLVHEHCEEGLGQPACAHYYGLPIDGHQAIRRFTVSWGQPGPLGCDDLRCME